MPLDPISPEIAAELEAARTSLLATLNGMTRATAALALSEALAMICVQSVDERGGDRFDAVDLFHTVARAGQDLIVANTDEPPVATGDLAEAEFIRQSEAIQVQMMAACAGKQLGVVWQGLGDAMIDVLLQSSETPAEAVESWSMLAEAVLEAVEQKFGPPPSPAAEGSSDDR